MDIITATIKLNEEGRTINRRDLINYGFDCEILVNNIKLVNNIQLNKENNITYIFKNKYTDLQNMFIDCKLLTSINLSNFNADNVTNIYAMLAGCTSLTSINFFNTNNIKEMTSLFNGCTSLASINLDIFNTCRKYGFNV